MYFHNTEGVPHKLLTSHMCGECAQDFSKDYKMCPFLNICTAAAQGTPVFITKWLSRVRNI